MIQLKRTLLLIALATICFQSMATGFSNGTIRGKVVDMTTRGPIAFANIIIQGTNTGTTTDINGKFELGNVTPGYVKIVVSYVGYKTLVSADIFVTKDKIPFVEIEMEATASKLTEIEIKGSQFVKKEESPVSLQTIGIREIERNPGGNRDISKVIQSLPGVASTPSFRNDIIIRGGSPSENKFYLDGIEVPVINHFQTQGSTGGPVGIINVNFIREVDFYSGAFPANRGNALSSILDFKQIDGSTEKMGIRATLGSSEVGLTADGPLGKKTTYIFSVRRSYLQFLFSLFKLPFLPTFTDTQFKIRHKFDEKNEIIFLGLGGYDQFNLNKKVNEDVTDKEQLEFNNYILGNLPSNTQWNYTIGAIYKHYGKNNVTSIALSRNQLNNESKKYFNNDESSNSNLLLNYNSRETENKLRIENTITEGTWRVNTGINLETAGYTVDGFKNQTTPIGPIKINFDSGFDILKYGVFASVSKPIFKDRLVLSAGIRADANTYSAEMNNPLDQLSPRLSASYSVTQKLSINFNTGRYYQLPAYTILGYGDQTGPMVNKRNNLTYISSDHLVGGLQFNPDNATKITVEGFYKKYKNYPYSIADSISLANLGSDFGVVGNEEANSNSKGRAYGFEFLLQRRSEIGIYGILSYTYVRSEFTNFTGNYFPSAWDNRNILTITAGKKLSKNWDAGFKWRYVGGRPYTLYNVEASSLKSNWDVSGTGILNYKELNTERLPAFHQLDIRIDKTYYYQKWSLDVYLDIQNLYNFKAKNPDILNVRTDDTGTKITDPNDPTRYETYFIKDNSGTVLPTIGIVIDF